jgi:hypothetical protein
MYEGGEYAEDCDNNALKRYNNSSCCDYHPHELWLYSKGPKSKNISNENHKVQTLSALCTQYAYSSLISLEHSRFRLIIILYFWLA